MIVFCALITNQRRLLHSITKVGSTTTGVALSNPLRITPVQLGNFFTTLSAEWVQDEVVGSTFATTHVASAFPSHTVLIHSLAYDYRTMRELLSCRYVHQLHVDQNIVGISRLVSKVCWSIRATRTNKETAKVVQSAQAVRNCQATDPTNPPITGTAGFHSDIFDTQAADLYPLMDLQVASWDAEQYLTVPPRRQHQLGDERSEQLQLPPRLAAPRAPTSRPHECRRRRTEDGRVDVEPLPHASLASHCVDRGDGTRHGLGRVVQGPCPSPCTFHNAFGSSTT